jgi:hypothetical protein
MKAVLQREGGVVVLTACDIRYLQNNGYGARILYPLGYVSPAEAAADAKKQKKSTVFKKSNPKTTESSNAATGSNTSFPPVVSDEPAGKETIDTEQTVCQFEVDAPLLLLDEEVNPWLDEPSC